jgi:hypothetical protein
MKIIKILLAALILFGSIEANAGLILQDDFNGNYQIDSNETLGQWFITEDENISIAFAFSDMNSHLDLLPTLTMNLFDGIGVGGSLLGSVSLDVSNDLDDWNGTFIDFDFSFLDLNVGGIYTASVEALNGRWGVNKTNDDNSYAFGSSIRWGNLNGGDLRFRVTPVINGGSVDVPEPTSLSIIAASLFGLFFTRRKKILNIK